MKQIALASSLAALLVAAPALAADLGGSMKDNGYDSPRGMVAWGGWSIGVFGGYGWGQFDGARNVKRTGQGFEQSRCDTTVTVGGESETSTVYGGDQASCSGNDQEWHGVGPDSDLARYEDSHDFGSSEISNPGKFDMNGAFGGGELSYKLKAPSSPFILEPFVDAYFGGGKGSQDFKNDIKWTDTEGNVSEVAGTETGSFSVKKRWGADIGMKAGILASSRDYLYGLGGLSYGSFNIKSHSEITGIPAGAPDGTADAAGTSLSDTDNAWGYTVGFGWERAITNQWHFGLEGRYTVFDGIGASASKATDVCGTRGCAKNPGGVNVTGLESVGGDYDEWSIRARLVYQFGN